MKPLEGLRILSVEVWGAGPYGPHRPGEADSWEATSMIQRVAHPAQQLRLLTSPIKIDGQRAGLAAAPALGAANASLLPR